MIDALLAQRLSSVERANLALRLRRGPWCWPDPEQKAAWRRAVEVGKAVPPMQPGDVPLVSVSPRATTLWALYRCESSAGFHREASVFGRDADRAWLDAAAALPKVLPFLWGSVAAARDVKICALEVISEAPPGSGAVVSHPPGIGGRSFGLAFLLSLASKVLGIVPPSDLIASAAVDPEGGLQPVRGISEKVRFVAANAPGIRRFLVHPDDAAAASRAAAGAPLDLIAVRTCGEAIEQAFDGNLGRRLVEVGETADQRAEFVDAMFRLAMESRVQTVDWTPVGRAAELALGWKDLSPADRYRLELARAVAARREHNEGKIGLPDPQWLEQLPLPRRLRVLFSLALQAAEAGSPDPAEMEALARSRLIRGPKAFAEHLLLQVALARLLSVTGGSGKALELVREAVEGLAAREELGRIGFPLAELYRLAAVEHDEAGYAQAERVRDLLCQRTALVGTDAAAVDLFRIRWKVERRSAGDDDVEKLQRIAERADVCAQVRYSALRWQARWLAGCGRDEEVRVLLAQMDTAGANGGRDAETARTFAALCRLDAAIAAGDADDAERALGALRAEDGGLVGNLQRALAARSKDLAVFVARAYPD